MPFVDTLLLLRPTGSATLFLQQLGRGLRLFETKQACLVLDFIGQHREEFRFDRILSAMTGLPRGGLREAVERGFPVLPSGCHLDLDREARKLVLENLKRSLRGGLNRLTEDLREVGSRRGVTVTLEQFLADTGRELPEVYASVGWTTLRRAAGLLPSEAPEGERELGEKFRQLLHIDDPDRLALYARAAREPQRFIAGEPARATEAKLDRVRLLMLGYQLFHAAGDRFDAEEILRRLAPQPQLCAELDELFSFLLDRVSLAGVRRPPDEAWPLALHRRYHRREVLTATGSANSERRPVSQAGVWRIPDRKTELLFVTLDKSGKRFSPTTRYEDYAISADLFHWQSQSDTSSESNAGRRYIEQRANGWGFRLFVRPTTRDAFTYLGPVHYQSHTGSRPMSIVWQLQVPIPGTLLQQYASLAA